MNHRARQIVSTKSQHKTVAEWMIAKVEQRGTDKGISRLAVEHFSNIFKFTTKKAHSACLKKAYRWWNGRHVYIAALQQRKNRHMAVYSRTTPGIGIKRIAVKALSGRGRKRSAWVEYLHTVLLQEYERLEAAGMQLSRSLLRDIAVILLHEDDSLFQASYVDETSGRPIVEHITVKWIDSFLNRHNIVTRKQSGSLTRSPAHTRYTEQLIAHHLGKLQRDFDSGVMDENMVENMDETHFIFNMDNHKTLGKRGAKKVNYVDVVQGGEGFTMVLRMTGGVNAKIEAPFLIFKNKQRNHPMRGTPDNVPGASYRTQPRGWMDAIVFNQWLREPRAIKQDADERDRFLFTDNASGHKLNAQTVVSLNAIMTELCFLPANATHLIQPLDAFIIQKIKEVWHRLWALEKMERLKNGDWADGIRKSGKLQHPGRGYYLKLAARCVSEVNAMKDKDGLPLVRKAMIRCGLSLNTTGKWEKSQLFDFLQDIIRKYPSEFNGQEPVYNPEI